MQQIYSSSVLSSHEIHCVKCGWKGKGNEITQEHLFLTDAIELFCPACNGYFGFINDSQEDAEKSGI